MKRRTPTERAIRDLELALTRMQGLIEPYKSERIGMGDDRVARLLAEQSYWYRTHVHNIVLLSKNRPPVLVKGTYKTIRERFTKKFHMFTVAQLFNIILRAHLNLTRVKHRLPVHASLVFQHKHGSPPMTLVKGLKSIRKDIETTMRTIRRVRPRQNVKHQKLS
jgi:hypothetical protein